MIDQGRNPIDRVARVRNDEQAAAGKQPTTLAIHVRGFDARPRLDQGNRRCARLLANRDEEPFAGSGLDDHPLIEQDVLLEPALEVVPKGGVRGRRQEVPIVRLDQAPLADAMTAHLIAHGDDAPNGLVPGDRRQPTRRIRGDLGQHFRVEPRDDRALSGMARERMQKLRVRKADPDRLHPHEDLVRPRDWHGLLTVVQYLAGVHDLDGVLSNGNLPLVRIPTGHASAPHYFSIT